MDEVSEDTAAELVDWLVHNGVDLARRNAVGDLREVPYDEARQLIQHFLDGSRRSTAFDNGVAPKLVLERLGAYHPA